VTAVDNLNLLGSAYVNQSTKQLILNTSAGASGRGSITLRATDPGGLTTFTTLTVDVNYDNQPPQITEFSVSFIGSGTWIVSGRVSDADDDVSRFRVHCYGLINRWVAVDEDGWFQFAATILDESWGEENAVTHDPHGQQSNIAEGLIGLT
jgi:hypothetical protein